MTESKTALQKWSRLLFYFWCYTLLVILWGAWVRISHSGNGCGNHWPLCEGTFIPTGAGHKTWIEYAHRLMSGSYGFLVVFIFWKLKDFKLGPFFKSLNVALLVLMITEGAIGALLVKGQLVTENDSLARLVVMSFHQLNSFLLTGVTYLLYVMTAHPEGKLNSEKKYTLILFLLLPITGAIAALSTTLFPAVSVWQGIVEDFTHNQHLFIRLRILHPILGIVIALGFAYWLHHKKHTRLGLEFLAAVAIGIFTLLTLSPVYLKLIHLLIAHFLWSRVLQLFVSFPDSSKR